MKKILLLLICSLSLALTAGSFTVKPENALIVVDSNAGAVTRLAARELQYHIRMMTGKKIPIASKPSPGKYIFLFEKPASAKLKPEEAVWETEVKQTRFYGDNDSVAQGKKDEFIFRYIKRTGDLTAVYDFLERQLGFLFLAPGRSGTSYTPASELKLKSARNSWDPGQLVKREIRHGIIAPKKAANDLDLPLFYRKKAAADLPKRNLETLRWLKQHRTGASVHFRYGHAFTKWWARYGAKHPEYFGLYNGKRAPWGNPANIKICPSNEGLINRIVDNWKNTKPRPAMINVCENDWGNFCECMNCRKLDAPILPGKKWDSDLTDRYLRMANEVVKRARKIDPQVKVGFYAYSAYRFPPRRNRVEPGIVIGFVPHMMTYEKSDEMYKEWRRKGAEVMFQRPNDQHINTGLPMGIEEIMFKHFQVGFKNGMVGTDYDSLHGFWAATGIADYILARAHVFPERSFEEHFNEYCSAYGAAAPEVKEYYTYWRKEIFEKRLLPNRKKIAERGKYGNFRRGLMWDLEKYYFEKDFDITDKILRNAQKKKLNSRQKELLDELSLANKHARLTYRALAASGNAKLPAARELHKFRIDNWDKINMNWYRLFDIESGFGDVTGGKLAAALERFSDGKVLSSYWFFTPDPKKEGEKLKWHKTSFAEGESCWQKINVNSNWENPGHFAHPALRAFMKNYDGIGWYSLRLDIPEKWKGKKIFLLFGAVDESAWIYLNGKLCGTRIFKNSNDWKTAFTIRIDENINWNEKYQSLVVKVQDLRGQGGIWRPVVLAVE